MSYLRILPRDAFNEANFLKCIGLLELSQRLCEAYSQYDNGPFDFQQNENDGSIYIVNYFWVAPCGRVDFYRQLNAREALPLRAVCGENDVEVLDAEGKPSREFLRFLTIKEGEIK